MHKENLTWEQQHKINQVVATMNIENMPLTQEDYNNVKAIITGRKTVDEIVTAIKKEYLNAK